MTPSVNPVANAKNAEASPDGGASCAERTMDEIRTAAWLKFLLVWLFALVAIGGTVRITKSGLSIPEWPIIYHGPDKTKPSLLPPFSEAAWENLHRTYHVEVIDLGVHGDPREMATFKREFALEYTHRFVAGVVALVFIALIVQTIRKPVLRRRIGLLMGLSAAILFAQIVLGGLVVKTHTPTLSVSYHLCMAFIYVALIAWMAMRLGRAEGAPRPERPSRQARAAWIVLALCFVQIFSGGLVANTDAGRVYNTWPLMAERLVPPAQALWQAHYEPAIRNIAENTILIQWTHRWFAFVVVAGVLYLAARLLFLPLSAFGRWMARASVFVLVVQMILGVITLLEAVDPWWLGIVHLCVGLVLFLVLLALAFELHSNAEIVAYEAGRVPAGAPESALEVQTAGLS